MRLQIQQNFFNVLFFRPDLITTIRPFLPDIIHIDDIPKFYRNIDFFNILSKNSIKIVDEEKKMDKKGKVDEKDEEQKCIKKIIEEDNLELLQEETEKNKNIILEDSFFEYEEMKIPIVHYCVMKKAMKCFKFLILNGADPSQTLKNKKSWKHEYKWDCISIAICFGEWEMMRILEVRGIDKFNNPKAWKAAALTHRNHLLKQFIEMKEEIDHSLLKKCLEKGLLEATKGNNLKATIILISNGADINAKYIIYQNMK